jgi:hypothetical protein
MLETLSRKLRVYLSTAAVPGPDGQRPDADQLRAMLRAGKKGKRPEWLRAEAIPTMLQVLMPEDRPVRRVLVELLAEIQGPRATVALARRAVFDLDADVRQAAVAALQGRPAEDYRPVLLKALRYPWAPAADHAAEALAELRLRDAVPELVALLGLPDPAGPQVLPRNRKGVPEVVRANHLTNCLLCHPPAATPSESVLGLDPVVTVPARGLTPAQAASIQRLGSTPGSHAYNRTTGTTGTSRGRGRTSSTQQVPALIRGDITFLRQDFSVRLPPDGPALPANPAVRLPVPGPALPGNPAPAGGPALTEPRFDYVVRVRPLTPAERAQLKTPPADRPTYPQREAVLFALRELTGRDVGDKTTAWQELFPKSGVGRDKAGTSSLQTQAEKTGE